MDLDQLSLFQFKEDSFKKFNLSIKDKRELLALINDSIYNRCAKTSKEKYEILDLRDKILKLIRYDVDNQLQSSSKTIDNLPSELSLISLHGTCQDMCPERERYSREYLNLCNKYEMYFNPEQNSTQIDHHLMIKEYSRSSADQDLPLCNEMRPIAVLYETMLYLTNEIMTKIETHNYNNQESEDENEASLFSVGEWYDFIWNRTRSIRKDIIQQRLLLANKSSKSFQNNDDDHDVDNLNDEMIERIGGVLIIEQCARFHIMCAYRLSEEKSEVFDFKINDDHLKNCFQSLRQFYELTSSSSLSSFNPSLSKSPNEAEFRAYIILLNLNESNILSEIQRWPKHIRHSSKVRFALSVYFAYNSHNYVKFFRLIKSDECEYLQACLLHRYFARMRCEAFKLIFSSYKEKNERVYPVEKLVDLLGFDEYSQAEAYCISFDMDLIGEPDTSSRMANLKSNNLNVFNMKKLIDCGLQNRKSHLLVQSKFYSKLNSIPDLNSEECLSLIIIGSEQIRESRFSDQNNLLSSSFNEEGYFVSREIEDLLAMADKVLSSMKHTQNENYGTEAVKSKLAKAEMVTFKNILNKTAAASQVTNSTLVKKAASTLVKKALNKSKVKASPTTVDEEADLKTSGLAAAGQRERKKSGSPVSSSESVSFKQVKLKKPVDVFGASAATTKISTIAQQTTATKPEQISLFDQEPGKKSTNLFESIIKKPQLQQQQTIDINKPTVSIQPGNLFSKIDSSTFASSISNPFAAIAAAKQPVQQPSQLAAPAGNLFAQTISQAPSLFGQRLDFKTKQAEQSAASKPVPEGNLFTNLLFGKKSAESTLALTAEPVAQALPTANKDQQLDQLSEHFFQSIYLELMREMSHAYFFAQKTLPNELCESFVDSCLPDLLRTILHETLIDAKRLNLAQMREQLFDRLSEGVLYDLIRVQTLETSSDFIETLKSLESYLYEEVLCSLFQKEFELVLKQTAAELNHEIKLDRLSEAVYLKDESRKLDEREEEIASKNSIFMQDLCSFLYECCTDFTRLNLNVNLELYYELNQAVELNNVYLSMKAWRLKSSLVLLKKAYTKNKQCGSTSSENAHLISFLIKYANYLIQNMSKFYKVYAFFVSNTSKQNSLNIIHSQEFQLHLAKTLHLEHKYFLYDLFMENYFNIINNRDTQVILGANSQCSNSDSSINSAQLKIIFAMPVYDHGDNQIEKWLHEKFFKTEANHLMLECLNLDNLSVDSFGVKFCLKFHDTNKSLVSDSSREFFATNSLIVVLSPKMNTNELCAKFGDLVKRVGQSNLKNLMFISLLNSDAETQQILNRLLKTFPTDINLIYLVLEKDSRIKNFSLLIQSYEKFLCQSLKSYRRPKEFDSLSSSDSNLLNICYITLFKCVESAQKEKHVTFKDLIYEYNEKLRALIDILANREFTKLNWPIPEFISDREKWTLIFWNSDECLNQVLKRQLYEILILDELDLSDEDFEAEQDLSDLDYFEPKLAEYYKKTFDKKSAYLIENNFSKLESCLSNNLKRLRENSAKMSNENLARLVLIPLIDYLTLNSKLEFQNKQIPLDKFYIYYDAMRIKNYDWTSVRRKSLNELQLSLSKARKYESIIKTRKYNKRRYSVNSESLEHDKDGKSETVSSELASLNSSLVVSPVNKKQSIFRPKETSPVLLECVQLDSKFAQFFNSLNNEKENNKKFEKRLSSMAKDSDDHTDENDRKIKRINSSSSSSLSPLSVNIPNSYANNNHSSFEDLLKILKEEKLKTERFNNKLNELLDY